MTIRQKIRTRMEYLKKTGLKAKAENDQVLMVELLIRLNECEHLMKNL